MRVMGYLSWGLKIKFLEVGKYMYENGKWLGKVRELEFGFGGT